MNRTNPARVDPERRTNFRRRAIRMFLVTLFVSGVFAAMLGRGGYLELQRVSRKVDRQHARIESERAELQKIRATIQSLEHDPTARERIARERLGMAGPGEILFLLPEQER